MKGTPATFWGKLERDESDVVTEWHPVVAHCADVAACAEALLQQTLLRRRLATLAGRDDLNAVDVARLSVTAALHDIGKYNRGFQRKGDAEPRDTAGHVAEVLALFGSGYAEEKQLFAQLPIAELDSWCNDGGAIELLVAAVGHHGRPVRCGEVAPEPSLWRAHLGDPHRPPGFKEARAIVMISDMPLEASIWKSGEARGKHGVGTVYDDLVILEGTRRRLVENGRLVIPEQNRELVERTTHPEALDEVVRSLGEIWQKHRNKVFGVERAHVGIADLNLVDRTRRFGDYSFKQTDLSERISARLGESDRRAVFAEPPLGPFGGKVRELTLPGWLTREAPADPELVPTEVQAGAGPLGACVRFAFGPLRFLYDRLGLRRDAVVADPSEDVADA